MTGILSRTRLPSLEVGWFPCWYLLATQRISDALTMPAASHACFVYSTITYHRAFHLTYSNRKTEEVDFPYLTYHARMLYCLYGSTLIQSCIAVKRTYGPNLTGYTTHLLLAGFFFSIFVIF